MKKAKAAKKSSVRLNTKHTVSKSAKPAKSAKATKGSKGAAEEGCGQESRFGNSRCGSSRE